MLFRPKFAALPIGLLVAATACLTASVPTYINVTSVVHDQDTAVPPNQLLMRSDDYNGYFQATYTNTANKAGTSGVRSQIETGGGSWLLYLGNQSLRTIWLTLSSPVAGSPAAPAPDGYYYANVEVYSQCFDLNNQATGWLVIPPGYYNPRCNLGVDFSSGGVKYKLVMGPTTSGTGSATVNCNGGNSTGACNSWTLTAGSGNAPAVANLYQFSSAKGNVALVYIGSYYSSFRMDVTNP